MNNEKNLFNNGRRKKNWRYGKRNLQIKIKMNTKGINHLNVGNEKVQRDNPKGNKEIKESRE